MNTPTEAIATPTFTPLYETTDQAISGILPVGTYPAGFDAQMGALLGQACVLSYMQYGTPDAPIDLSDLPTFGEVSSYVQVGTPLTWTESIGTGTGNLVNGQPSLTDVQTGSAGFTTVPFGFGFSAVDSGNKPLFNVIVFRGTRSYSEWISDADALPTVCEIAKGPDLVQPALVHNGFYQLYVPSANVPVEGTLQSQVYAILEALSSSHPVPLYLTGHSLGGALAELCASDIGYHKTEYFNELYVYSLASPQLAAGLYLPSGKASLLSIPTTAFTSVFTVGVTGAYRVVNAADLVPILPAQLGSSAGSNIEFAPSISPENTLNFLAQTGAIPSNHDCLLYAGFLNQLPSSWPPAT